MSDDEEAPAPAGARGYRADRGYVDEEPFTQPTVYGIRGHRIISAEQAERLRVIAEAEWAAWKRRLQGDPELRAQLIAEINGE